mmetsp:Transcript_19753/g.47995  ORF Transcript_19753/g.47995 Transcript_19753/m.47995 type:complete len:314 (-) Transcript_19753:9-950(-)
MLRFSRKLFTHGSPLVSPWLLQFAQRIGISESGFDRMLEKSPCLRGRGAEQLVETEEQLRVIGLNSTEALRRAVTASPAILCLNAVQVQAVLESLRLVTGMTDVGPCVAMAPALLLLDSEQVRQRTLAISAMNMDAPHLVTRVPRILLRETRSLQRLFAALSLDSRGPLMHPVDVQKIFTEFPIVLSFNPENTVFPLAGTLRSRLGLNPASQDCRAFYAWPTSADTLNEATDFLVSAGYTTKELADCVSLLAYSLQARIIPRVLFVSRLGRPRQALPVVAEMTDARFCEVIGCDVDQYRDFCASRRAQLRAAR